MPKCPSCGHENPAGVDLCKSCGARIPMQETPAPSLQPTPHVDAERPAPGPDSLEGQVLAELEAGRKISAVKIYRAHKNVGLKEAKDAVEELGHRHGIVATRTGCAGVLLLLFLGACGTLVAVF